jgi:hypothetical protein
MSNIKVNVIDGNNVNLQVVPQPRIDLLIDRGAAGPQGQQGPTGPQGQGLEITGSVATPEDLPTVGQVGDQYFVQSTNSVYIWSNT